MSTSFKNSTFETPGSLTGPPETPVRDVVTKMVSSIKGTLDKSARVFGSREEGEMIKAVKAVKASAPVTSEKLLIIDTDPGREEIAILAKKLPQDFRIAVITDDQATLQQAADLQTQYPIISSVIARTGNLTDVLRRAVLEDVRRRDLDITPYTVLLTDSKKNCAALENMREPQAMGLACVVLDKAKEHSPGRAVIEQHAHSVLSL